jgi:UDP-N-acetylglucosamine 2-epimerase (non-hydrolysing)
VEIVFPVHRNPNVRTVVNEMLTGYSNIHLIEPLDYPEFIWLINKSSLILTDSGGVQEEAPSLGKPVLVLRDNTERQEGIDAGTARLVTTSSNEIFDTAFSLLTDPEEYKKMANAVNPYGDGTTSKQIVEILLQLPIGKQ